MDSSMGLLIVNVKELEDFAVKYFKKKNIYNPSTKKINQKVLNFIRGHKYDGFRWTYTAGRVDDAFAIFVNSQSTYIYNYFYGGYGENVSDGTGIKVDVPHLCATLDGMLSYTTRDCWNGWAGDVATAMRDADSLESQIVGDSKYCANLVIGNEDYSCGYIDLCADADAITLIDYLREGKKLSKALELYYDGAHKNRFANLVSELGGPSKMKETVEKELSSFVLLDILAKNPRKTIQIAVIDRFVEYIKNLA